MIRIADDTSTEEVQRIFIPDSIVQSHDRV